MSARFLFLAGACLLATVPGLATAQQSPCLTNADTAARYAKVVLQDVSYGDSTLSATQGLPYRPAQGVSLVKDTLVCRAIVKAYNALDTVPTHPARIEHAYVFMAGTTVYAMVSEKARSVRVYFDTTYHWLAALVSLD